MRIFLSSGHIYPGWINGVSSHRVHDNLARGLAALGHDVRYRPEGWGQAPPPEGIRPVSGVDGDEDILHVNHLPLDKVPATRIPWVVSVHADVKYNGLTPDYAIPNWIYVSRSLAGLYGSDRFVYNGIDPADFIYSEAKEDYFLFAVAGAVKRAQMKGVEIAFRIARMTGVELRVAGGSNNPAEMEAFDQYCRDNGAVCVGLVHGRRKAELFAGARALLFPTQMNEAFGVTVAEALMSGTPVIASDKGAMGELLNPSVGFVCTDESSYLDAVASLARIDPADCRRLAMERFHYVEMARSYVREYEREIVRTSRGGAPSPATRRQTEASLPSAEGRRDGPMPFFSIRSGQFAYFSRQLGIRDWRGKDVLDFGGNVGNILRDPECTIDEDRYWCMDVIREAIERGRLQYPKANWLFYDRYNFGFNPDGIRGLRIPEIEQRFDIIVAYSVFTSTPREELVELVGQLGALLKDDGVLAFSFIDPRFRSWPGRYGGSNLEYRLERYRARGNPIDIPGLVARASDARWFTLLNEEDLYLEGEPEKDYATGARKSCDAYYTAEFIESLYPRADVLPPVNGEMQHCCVLRRSAAPAGTWA